MLGGDGNDTQRLHMADGLADEMTLGANGGVATFARTNLSPFTVNMQDVERVIIVGNGGDDELAVDNVEDGGVAAVHFSGSAGDDVLTVAAGTSARMIANGGDGDDQLAGGDGIDVLTGGAGEDTLSGSGGRDRLIGQTGNDVMTGGDDRDVFVLTTGSGDDQITDFEIGIDILRYNGVAFGFADLVISDNGGDLSVLTTDGDTVLLLGLAGAILTATEVLIVP